jgi:predicted secreted protein
MSAPAFARRLAAALAAQAVFAILPALAQAAAEDVRYNSVDLRAEVQREVANDLLNASLYVELTDSDPARLADALNKTVNEALKAAGDYKSVRAHSGASQTYPVYDRPQHQTGWRGRSEIRLESQDFSAAAQLIGRLQSSMQLGGMNFAVSAEARRQTEDQLIAEAIAAFRARAEIARQALGGKSYRIRHLAVNTGGFGPPPRPYAAARALSSAEVATPVLEGGISQVTVGVTGTIEVE